MSGKLCYAFALVAVMALSATALAQADFPHQFYGSVTVNGAPAADGMLVTAKVDGAVVSGTTTSDGRYGYDPVFFVPDPYRNREGKTVEFYVSGVKAAEYTFENGKQTRLDLSVTVSQPPQDDSGGSSGGGRSSGGGGSSGGGTVITTTYDEEETCTESWSCTDWFECSSGRQARKCTDLNSCGTEDDKPAERQDCSVRICTAEEMRCDGDDIVSCSQNEDSWTMIKTCEEGCTNGSCNTGDWISGFFLNPVTGTYALVIFFMILLLAAVAWKSRVSTGN